MTELPNATSDDSSAKPQLHRKLGLLNATSINMSNMIGIGPFITVPPILMTMGGPQALISWGTGAIIAIADGLVVSELGASLPGSGGPYVFLRQSYPARWGKFMAWMFIWQFLFSGTLEIASGSIGMVQYLTFLWTGLAAHPWGMKCVAGGISALVMLSLYRRVQDVAKLMLILWITTLVTTGWVILSGLTHVNLRLALDFPPNAFSLNWAFIVGLGNGTVLVLYNYLGYNQVCYLGGEVKKPERTIPYAVILSIVGVTLIDFLLSFSFVSVVPWKEMTTPGSPAYNAVASVFMGRIYGPWAAALLSVMILFTAFASVFALMLGYSRVPYAAALDGAFFRWFGVLHPRGEFPHRSLVLVGVLCVAASFFGLVEIITALVLARILVVFVGQIIGLLILRKHHPEVPRPFKMWLYPAPAVVALLGWLYAFASPAASPGGWKVMVYALGTLVAGIAAYALLSRITVGRAPETR
jgi:amino acid transporter